VAKPGESAQAHLPNSCSPNPAWQFRFIGAAEIRAETALPLFKIRSPQSAIYNLRSLWLFLTILFGLEGQSSLD
jgi:hypothetical protein